MSKNYVIFVIEYKFRAYRVIEKGFALRLRRCNRPKDRGGQRTTTPPPETAKSEQTI